MVKDVPFLVQKPFLITLSLILNFSPSIIFPLTHFITTLAIYTYIFLFLFILYVYTTSESSNCTCKYILKVLYFNSLFDFKSLAYFEVTPKIYTTPFPQFVFHSRFHFIYSFITILILYIKLTLYNSLINFMPFISITLHTFIPCD